jgi:signal transduction histidine kinase
MQREVAAFTNRITFTYFNELSLDAMCRRSATLPPNSAVYYGMLWVDGAGVPHDEESALKALHASANAPIFGLFEEELGSGIVGGNLISLERWGKRIADAAVRILDGEPLERINIEPVEPGAPVYDWRELQRWDIDATRLPPGSKIRFHQPTLWEQYKWRIVGVILLCVAEAMLIFALLVQLRRRRQAEFAQQRSRDELAHIARVSTMGQLTSTLAHEINQPLGAILRNTEAAELFLQKRPPDFEELRTILADIRRDNQRAGDVIDRLRTMLKRRELQFEPISLKSLVDQMVNLTQAELESRKIRLQVEMPHDLPPVRGDRVQLQQVLLNLIFNGADAMNDQPPGDRQLTVCARGKDGRTVEMAVSDRGHGIPAEMLAQIFHPFFTTKANGLGMGLAISQTIINTHGGRIWAENNPGGGACFRFTVPVATTGGLA